MKTKILTIFALVTILISTIVSATVYEANYVYEGIIQPDGTGLTTTTPIKGVSVVGYICQDSACETATRLWPNTLNTGSDNVIVLPYPTNLQSEYGYIVYFFKKGYVPYAVRADWYGEGNAGKYENYLRKFETGSAQIKNFKTSDSTIQTGETITITADILSPSEYSKNWYVPEEIKEQLKDKVKITLEITDPNGEIVPTITETEIEWSSETEVTFEWTPEQEGEYTLKIITQIIDDKFLDSEIEAKQIQITVSEKSEPEPQEKSIPTGYRNINKNDTWEDEQYEAQFKYKKIIQDEEKIIIEKQSLWQKFIRWLKNLFYKIFWFL